MRIPVDISGINAKVKAAFNKTPVTKVDPALEAAKLRQGGSDAAKERAKRKAIADELASEKTSAARRQEIIDGQAKQLEEMNEKIAEYEAKIEELTPAAKAHSQFLHKERTKLIQSFPPEEQKDAKAIIDSMELDVARKYTSKATGVSTDAAGKDATKGGKSNWETLTENMEKDPAKFDAAVAADPTGFNEYMNSRGK